MSNSAGNMRDTSSMLAALRRIREQKLESKEQKQQNVSVGTTPSGWSHVDYIAAVGDSRTLLTQAPALQIYLSTHGFVPKDPIKWTDNPKEQISCRFPLGVMTNKISKLSKELDNVWSEVVKSDPSFGQFDRMAAEISQYIRTSNTAHAVLSKFTEDMLAMKKLDESTIVRWQQKLPQPLAITRHFPARKWSKMCEELGQNYAMLAEEMSLEDFLAPVKYNKKSDAGLAYRKPDLQAASVTREEAMRETCDDLVYVLEMLKDPKRFPQWLTTNVGKRKCAVMLKPKYELVHVTKLGQNGRQRPYFVFPAWFQALVAGIYARIWKPVYNFLEDQSSTLLHTVGWHHGNATEFLLQVTHSFLGLSFVHASDDSFWWLVLPKFVIEMEGGKRKPKVCVNRLAGNVWVPIEEVKDNDRMVVEMSYWCPDIKHCDGNQHSQIFNTRVADMHRIMLENATNGKRVTFARVATAVATKMWWDAPVFVDGIIWGQAQHHGLAGHGGVSVINNMITDTMFTYIQNEVIKGHEAYERVEADFEKVKDTLQSFFYRTTEIEKLKDTGTEITDVKQNKDGQEAKMVTKVSQVVVEKGFRLKTGLEDDTQGLRKAIWKVVDRATKELEQINVRMKEETKEVYQMQDYIMDGELHEQMEITAPILGFTLKPYKLPGQHQYVALPEYSNPAKALASLRYITSDNAKGTKATAGVKMAQCLGICCLIGYNPQNPRDRFVYELTKKLYNKARQDGGPGAWIGGEAVKEIASDLEMTGLYDINVGSLPIAPFLRAETQKSFEQGSEYFAPEFPSQAFFLALYLPKAMAEEVKDMVDINVGGSKASEINLFDLLADLDDDGTLAGGTTKIGYRKTPEATTEQVTGILAMNTMAGARTAVPGQVKIPPHPFKLARQKMKERFKDRKFVNLTDLSSAARPRKKNGRIVLGLRNEDVLEEEVEAMNGPNEDEYQQYQEELYNAANDENVTDEEWARQFESVDAAYEYAQVDAEERNRARQERADYERELNRSARAELSGRDAKREKYEDDYSEANF